MSVVSVSRTSSPPPLDMPLPNQFDQCELKLEVQPRSYHRAHYETEGSRGSIKAANVGHPVVKVSHQFWVTLSVTPPWFFNYVLFLHRISLYCQLNSDRSLSKIRSNKCNTLMIPHPENSLGTPAHIHKVDKKMLTNKKYIETKI